MQLIINTIRTNNVQRYAIPTVANNILCLAFYNRTLIASRHIEYFLHNESHYYIFFMKRFIAVPREFPQFIHRRHSDGFACTDDKKYQFVQCCIDYLLIIHVPLVGNIAGIGI